MGKKKDLDFKKVKIKIGKSKPSNNVTKFNIKTSKIVIPGENKKELVKQARDETYFSRNENHLLDNLKYMHSALLASINKKTKIMTSTKLDLTQSTWKTISRVKWQTPWDNVIEDFYTKIGSMEIYYFMIFDNALNHKELKVNEEAIKCLNLYFELFSNTSQSVSTTKRAIPFIKRLMKSNNKNKMLLALELALSLAKYCPFAFWHAARWRSAVFILELLQKCLTKVDKVEILDLSDNFLTTSQLYDSLMDMNQFLSISEAIIASVVDGRRAGMVIVGEEASQLNDVAMPPFDDPYYLNQSYMDDELRVVTDAEDRWDPEDMEAHEKFNLNQFLTGFADAMLDIGIKLLPVSAGCEKSLAQLAKIVKILSRCCLRSEANGKWMNFIEKLVQQFPYAIEKPAQAVSMEIDSICASKKDLTGLSKKERKLQQKRLELDQKMVELCSNAKTIKNSKNEKLFKEINDELNIHTVALVHQCLISDKVVMGNESISNWTNQLKQFLSNCDWSRNEMILQWLSLGRQIIQLSYDRFNPSALAVNDIFLAFSFDMFLGAHCASKVKRVALANYVQACLRSVRIRDESITYPLIDNEFWTILIDLIIFDTESGTKPGLSNPHPAKLLPIAYFDVTSIRAGYMLLQEKYPGIVDLFRNTGADKKMVLKQCFTDLRRNLNNQSNHAAPDDYQAMLRNQLSETCFWDYFTSDLVDRKTSFDGIDWIGWRLKPLCSSIDDILLQ